MPFHFPLLAMGFGLLLLSAVSDGGWLRLSVPGARPLASIAFSLYLTHKSVAHLVHLALPNLSATDPWRMLLACTTASVAGGAALYYTVERPCLLLRDRWLCAPHGSVDLQARLDPAV